MNYSFKILVHLSLGSILLSGCSYSSKTTAKLYNSAFEMNEGYDVIIVPGVPFENSEWSRIMKARVYWSKYLIDRGIAKNVMYSGSAVYTPYYEAEIMALYADAIGISSDNIYVEKNAEHSTENLYYSFKNAKKLGFKTIALASDPFQTKMLKKFARKKVNPNIEFIPIVFDTLRVLEPDMMDPEINYREASVEDFKRFIPLTEREGFFERFRGTRGLKIDPNLYD